jgi:hypothetical protein
MHPHCPVLHLGGQCTLTLPLLRVCIRDRPMHSHIALFQHLEVTSTLITAPAQSVHVQEHWRVTTPTLPCSAFL